MSDAPDFGEKMFTGVGYPTPVSIPEDTVCRTLHIPADGAWQALVMGVLYTLTQDWNWQQFEGGITREAAAERWSLMFDDVYNNLDCSPDVPAPYWDDADGNDADDTAPSDDQPWYGIIAPDGVTFEEQIQIWVIAAFVAVAATPAAAIAFLPLANRFVLAFHQHDLGGIVRVFINASEVAKVDTYAPSDGVINTTISLPESAMGFTAFDTEDPPVLWVVMSDEVNPAVDGEPNIQVIRKRLDQAEVTPPNIRWNSDCDCVQQTPDGGETWVDSPTQDPRTSPLFQVPARTGGDPRCDAAQQMHNRVKNMLDAIIVSSDILQAINAVVGVAAVFFFEIGIVIEAVWAIVSAIFSVGTTTLNAALTEEVYAELLCIFYCHIGSDGTVTIEQYDAIITKVNASMETVAAFAITQTLYSIGNVGLTNAGALGEVTGDCAACDCGWCITNSFGIDCPADMTLVYGTCDGSNGVTGIFLDGNSRSAVYAEHSFGVPVRVTQIQLTFSASWAGVNRGARIQGYLSGSQVFNVLSVGDGTHVTFTWDGDESIDYFNLQLNSGTDPTPCRLEASQISGLEDAPTLWSPCP